MTDGIPQTAAEVLKKHGIETTIRKDIPLKDLQWAPYNPRTINEKQLEDLKTSLRQFGVAGALAVARSEDLLVCGGHQRGKALRAVLREKGLSDEEIGDTLVPVDLIAGLTDKQAMVLNLALNKIQGEFDYDKLALVFQELAELPDDERAITGFSTVEQDDIMRLMDGGMDNPSEIPTEVDAQEEVEQAVREVIRTFKFEVDTDDEAAFLQEALKAFGNTGPKTLGSSFVAMARAGMAYRDKEKPSKEELPASAPETGKEKAKEAAAKGAKKKGAKK